jgi:3,4-dihydroxy 2-butanone 4-phosphate synthase / GTP cyclohydrolase II
MHSKIEKTVDPLLVTAHLPTKWGDFNIVAFDNQNDANQPHLALVHEGFDPLVGATYLRIHSECLTGDLFGSKRCDCGQQLEQAMQLIASQKGILIYLRQEGRGIGLINKLRAYNLQDEGLDTFEANTHLGFEPDERDFGIGVQIAKSLGVLAAILITNNPEKMSAFDGSDISVLDRVPIIIPPVDENRNYLRDKRNKMGHLL